MKVISLFCGAGGLDVGARMAGADVICSVDNDQDSLETIKQNLNGHRTNVINEDIFKLSGEEILERCKCKKTEIAFLVGGPPCQPFSKNNYWTKSGHESLRRKKIMKKRAEKQGRKFIEDIRLSAPKKRLEVGKDKRTNLVMEYSRIIKEISPNGFLFENVSSILHPQNKKYLNAFISSVEDQRYKIKVLVLSSEEFGVAQIRKRVFVLGHKKAQPMVPEITHSLEKTIFLKEAVTAGEAISKYNLKKFYEEGEIIQGTWARYFPDIPPGMNYKALSSWAGYKNPIFEAETRFWNFLLKLDPQRPSWTIASNPGPWTGPFHWNNRRLRTVEMAALQSFPEQYSFFGSRRSKIRQIGNAVPPLLAKAVISSLIKLEKI